jgi:hypothetical protein
VNEEPKPVPSRRRLLTLLGLVVSAGVAESTVKPAKAEAASKDEIDGGGP